MKYVFFGTPSFAARTLEILLEHDLAPVAIVCNPDRPVGRKKIITAPPVKIAAEAWMAKTGRTIEIWQPEKLDAEFLAKLATLQPDFFLVFAYNKIFRKNLLDIPRLGTIGIHPSLLPKYRGASPFQTALLDGAHTTGVTLYLLDEGIDSGPILVQSPDVAIASDDTFTSLATKLTDVGAATLIKILPDFLAGKISPQPQNESLATFTKKFKTEDGFIVATEIATAQNGDLETAQTIDRKIRAFNPEPGAWTIAHDGKRIKLLAAKIADNKLVLLATQTEGEKAKTGSPQL